MIGQTLAIFLDAYRDLNARKLFWITLVLSAVLVTACALVGVDATGIKIVTAHIDVPQAKLVYKTVFTTIVISIWLTWAATILALISTAGIFPDLLSGGSVDLYLAKPIGRARLFLTKYVAGLLFVTLQVLVVALGSYLVLGLRGGEWNPRLFWAVPIVLCFFSYLFGFCVLMGVMTRSTIAALLLTILLWAILGTIDRVEPGLLAMRNIYDAQAHAKAEAQAHAKAEALGSSTRPAGHTAPPLAAADDAADERRFSSSAVDESDPQDAASTERTAWWIRNVYRVVYGIKTITPKTTDTLGLLDRYLFASEQKQAQADMKNDGPQPGFRRRPPPPEMREAAQETIETVQARTPAWIIGTSLGFEAVVVGLAAWIFCRRDY